MTMLVVQAIIVGVMLVRDWLLVRKHKKLCPGETMHTKDGMEAMVNATLARLKYLGKAEKPTPVPDPYDGGKNSSSSSSSESSDTATE